MIKDSEIILVTFMVVMYNQYFKFVAVHLNRTSMPNENWGENIAVSLVCL